MNFYIDRDGDYWLSENGQAYCVGGNLDEALYDPATRTHDLNEMTELYALRLLYSDEPTKGH